jgi:predicted nuclease of restriction endonuclease-like (RecB) superfamily
VVITGVSFFDATAPYGDSADREDLEQPLMSVILQSYLNDANNSPYWGRYTPSTVTFKLVLTEAPNIGQSFEYTMPYLTTTNGLNPSYNISLYDMSKNVSHDLQNAFPETSGFSVRNLHRMRQFAARFPEITIVPQAVAQIPWGHSRLIIGKTKDIDEALFYVNKTIENVFLDIGVCIKYKIGFHFFSLKVNQIKSSNNFYHFSV